MNVFYFSSDLFASIAGTSMVSIMENNKSFDSIHFYIADDGIADKNKELLNRMVQKYKREVTYILLSDPSELLHYPFKDRYQIGHSYPRMCIGTLLPESVNRVLCLDSDTLILGDLEKLWNMDMQNNVLAGVADCMNLKAYSRQFQLTSKQFYCNAGMFLVDLKKWRSENIEKKITEEIYKKNGNVFFFEQTLMNYSCRGRIYRLSPDYNTYTLFYAFPYKNLICWRRPTNFYTEEEVDEAVRSPIIIHFTRNFYMRSRPWTSDCDHPLTSVYRKYKKLTPWKNITVTKKNTKQEIKYKLWHRIPQFILVRAVSVIYNTIRPKMWWKNE